MLKSFLTVLMLIGATLLTTDTTAQETKTPPTPEQRAAKLTDWMKKNLQLTEAQTTQVTPINLKYAQMAETVLAGTEGRMQKAKALKGYDKAKDEELKKIFTPEQFTTYSVKKEELKAEMSKRMKEKSQD